MRAREFITENMELRHEPTSTGGVQVYAYIDGKEAGWVRFTKLKTGQVKAAMVHVPERLRRQGIGSAMYKYARHKLGLDIVPSDSQTADGRAFWNKIHENITEDSFDGIDITMDVEDDEVFVKASAGGRELGHVLFVDEGDYLMPQDLEVDERFQGQGIARTMYDYVKSKGYKIRRSGQQTDAGAGFWNKHRQSQNVWEQNKSKG
jgi:predicted GNAT family acetyltransferase